jgi:hypothetical protein
MREAMRLTHRYGWVDSGMDGPNSIWRLRNATMTIQPNGDWACENPLEGNVVERHQGAVRGLEGFLMQFAVADNIR